MQAMVENTLEPHRESMRSSILGLGYVSLAVFKFTFLS